MEFNQFVNEVKGGIKQFLPIEYEDAQVIGNSIIG